MPATTTFCCHTPARPEQVWAALTDAGGTATYLYGLAVISTWQPGAPLVLQRGGHTEITGRVLCVHPHRRLSYVLQAGESDPPVYLTWRLRPSRGGCTIRLEVDEIDSTDSVEEAEDTWLPVLAALQRELE